MARDENEPPRRRGRRSDTGGRASRASVCVHCDYLQALDVIELAGRNAGWLSDDGRRARHGIVMRRRVAGCGLNYAEPPALARRVLRSHRSLSAPPHRKGGVLRTLSHNPARRRGARRNHRPATRITAGARRRSRSMILVVDVVDQHVDVRRRRVRHRHDICLTACRSRSCVHVGRLAVSTENRELTATSPPSLCPSICTRTTQACGGTRPGDAG